MCACDGRFAHSYSLASAKPWLVVVYLLLWHALRVSTWAWLLISLGRHFYHLLLNFFSKTVLQMKLAVTVEEISELEMAMSSNFQSQEMDSNL